MLDRVLIAARGPAALIRERIDALASWYDVRASVAPVAEGAVTVAALGAPLRGVAFGEEPPETLDLLRADELALRRYEGGGVALAVGADRARLVAGAGAPAVIYAAEAGEVACWSSHSVAASVVATGAAGVDPSSVVEQLAAEFVGDGRSLVAGVRVMAAASAVDLTAGGAKERCYWPARERWEQVPEDDAYSHTERHLLRSLGDRLAGQAQPLLGLTAGYDSRVVALALTEIGIPFEGFTWGAPDHEDVVGGIAAAEAVGRPHRHLAFDMWTGAEAVGRARITARWTEGAIHVGFGGIAWPEDMRTFVTGAGGETGRAFYWPGQAGTEPPPDVARVLSDALAGIVGGARPERIEALHTRVADWVAAAERSGASGWRLLDVVYGEQRVRRWLRGMVPHGPAPMVAAFATPEVQRGLMSLPLTERASSGFHRRFIEARRPDLLPEAAAAETASPGRRPLTRLTRRLQRGSLDGEWLSRPEFRDWIADDVLRSDLAFEALGEPWCRRTRSRFLAGDGFAVERCQWLAGPVALAEALTELREEL